MAGGMSRADAIAYLEQLAGIRRPTGRGKSLTIPSSGKKIARPRASDEAVFHREGRKQPDQAVGAYSDLYEKYLSTVCGPLFDSPGAEYLARRGIEASTAARVGVRYCSDPAELWKLADKTTIRDAGLASLYVFQKADLPFLVFPYIRRGRPVFIKTRCLLSKDDADRRGITRFLNTAGRVPCLWNHDAIEGADRVLVCEGEMDALTAIEAGQVGVGLPGWAHWKDEWIGDFRGKDIVLVLDADEAGRKGTQDIASRFIRAGHRAPRQLVIDQGKDLNEFFLLMRENKGQSI
jgi:hypothetical protein